MPLQPSRRDILGPPPRDVTDLAKSVRHHGSYLRSLDPGIQEGRFATPRPVAPGTPQLIGDGGGDGDSTDIVFEYNDTAVATVAGSVTMTLTYEPVEESLHVRWEELNVSAAYFTIDGRTVTITDPHIHAGDEFTAAYAYYPTEDEPAVPVLVGSTIVQGALTSIAMPAGVQAGDLLLLVCASFGPVSTTDHRIVGTHQAFGTGELVAWGYADGSGTPVAVSTAGGTSGYVSTALVVYRNVRVTGTPAQNTTTGSTLAAATIANAQAALVAVLAWNGTVSGNLNADSTGAWTSDASETHIKTNVRVSHWMSDTPTTTPPGSFLLTGDNSGFGAVTLLLEASE